MTGLLAGTVDAEAWCTGWLRTQLEGVTAVTETPNDLVALLPLVQVIRIGGADDGVLQDEPRLSVHAFQPTRPEAKALAQQVRLALYAAIGVVFDGALATKVSTVSGPSWTPYDDVNLRRVTGTYQLTLQPA